MNRSIFDDELLETTENYGFVPHLKNIPRQRKTAKQRAARARIVLPPVEEAVAGLQDEKLEMSYKASRYEQGWLIQSLETFFNQKWFDDVLRMVKGGKEASVYLCQGNATSGQDYLAAKVYRPRQFRNLRNDFLYRDGRENIDSSGNAITNKGMRHAIHKRTDYGRELMHTSWLAHEFQTMQALKAAGADVPTPFACDSNTILMGYYGDDVMGAPTLNEVSLPRSEAQVLFERTVHNIELMLSNERIHGDLSAYNILYWEGQIALIDFPQAIVPEENRSAYQIFERDVRRVCDYFQRQGVPSNPHKLAEQLWSKYQQRFVPLIDPKALDEDRDDERDIWDSLKNA